MLSPDNDGASDFLKSFADPEDDASKKKPSPEAEGDDDTQDDASDTDDSDDSLDDNGDDDQSGDEDTETTTADTTEKKYVADDGQFVKIKVGEEEKEVSVKDLKRLFGQEASLTQKSTEVANARKAAETEQNKYVTSLSVLLGRATEKANPYRNIDWMAVSKDPNISAEAASALRAEAQRALDDETFLGQSLNTFMAEVQTRQNAERAESAKACIKALRTEPTAEAPNPVYIKNWNDKTYDDVRSFGVQMGLSQDAVNKLVDPVAIKMMHMAMLFKRGAAKVVTTKAVNKTPAKIVKTSSSIAARPTKGTVEQQNALKTLKRSGSMDAAGDAFLASFADK
ncbi:hypothetical protein HU230_0012460 [Bradyrhizobium quebecense]|uniref:Scaffolding protein n=1 Tax=Bradyrhizobium quebecense TaxID=2748629 RepID=A0A974AGS3_9BRAD|nr:hypothetical protein [Bradyrhizobium quebecense]UGA46801.1 hypothetical protein HU230_0012460 [Bradyrhizobium quebecense]